MSEKKLILHVAQPTSGGVRDFIVEICRSLGGFRHIVAAPSPLEYARSDVKTVKWFGAAREIRLIRDSVAAISLAVVIIKLKPDVIHLHSSKAGGVGAFLSRIWPFKRFRVVYTSHGSSLLRTDVSGTTLNVYKRLERFIYRSVDSYITCSVSEQSALRRFGVESEVICNSIPSDAQLDSCAACKTDVQDLGSPVVVSVGRNAYQKNPDLFVEIAKLCPDVRFLWLGAELPSLHNSENSKSMAWIEPCCVERIISKASIFLSTSRWEGASISGLQAIRHGLPIVASRVTGNVDYVEEGRNGWLFDSAEEAASRINQILGSSASGGVVAQRYSSYSRDLFEKKFSYVEFLADYCRVYGGR